MGVGKNTQYHAVSLSVISINVSADCTCRWYFIILTLVVSMIDYCNSLLDGLLHNASSFTLDSSQHYVSPTLISYNADYQLAGMTISSMHTFYGYCSAADCHWYLYSNNFFNFVYVLDCWWHMGTFIVGVICVCLFSECWSRSFWSLGRWATDVDVIFADTRRCILTKLLLNYRIKALGIVLLFILFESRCVTSLLFRAIFKAIFWKTIRKLLHFNLWTFVYIVDSSRCFSRLSKQCPITTVWWYQAAFVLLWGFYD